MAQSKELGLALLVGKTVKETEYEEREGVMRIVFTFDDGSQFMAYGEGIGYGFREGQAAPLQSLEQIVAMAKLRREA